MVNSGIGGQAVIEGIMMRNREEYSVAVRKEDGEIALEVHPCGQSQAVKTCAKIPLLRGVISFVDSLVIGINTLMISASYFEEEEDAGTKENDRRTPQEKESDAKKAERKEKAAMTLTVIVSLIFAIALFMMLPYFVSDLLGRIVTQKWIISLFEAILRILIFLLYLVLISRMEDIQRTYMYHGAEHKCINCIENGMELNVDNVMKSSRFHKRCGTSFLVYVVLISAVLLMFVQAESHIMRIVIRLLLIPVIAGISYEVLRLAARTDNAVTRILSKPGIAMQHLTTREPDREQAEVAIKAVEAVFDWKAFLQENFEKTENT